MFGLSSLATYAVIAVAAVAIAGGAYWYVFHKGVESERSSNAGKALAETEEQRVAREAIERRNRELDDAAATERLRPGPGR